MKKKMFKRLFALGILLTSPLILFCLEVEPPPPYLKSLVDFQLFPGAGYYLPGKMGPEQFAILSYHGVLPGGWLSTDDVSEDKFLKDLAHLTIHGYRFISFRDIMDGNLDPEGQYIILTFDDGTKDHYEIVRPILNEFDIPGVFYIIAGSVGWSAFMDWEQIQQLIDEGHEIGSHTHSHFRLPELEEEELFTELVGSKEILERELDGQGGEAYQILSLAYPYCDVDEGVLDFLEQHQCYAFAVICNNAYIGWGTLEQKALLLDRFLMRQSFEMELFF